MVENWNSANDALFYGKDSELTGADRDSQEISVLALHLLQSALVYVNTLLLQRILADRPVRLTDEDRRALTPLFWTHVRPVRRPSACTWTATSTSTRARSRMTSRAADPQRPTAATGTASAPRRTPPKRKARQLAKYLRDERPDYAYLKAVFRALRAELGVEVHREPKTLPYVPTEAEIRRYYQTVWQGTPDRRRRPHQDPALHRRPRRRTRRHPPRRRRPRRLPDPHHPRQRRQGPHRPVPHLLQRDPRPAHQARPAQAGGDHLFESTWKKPYSTRGVRALLARYAAAAGMTRPSAPTSCGTSCSPGSRPKASTTPSSSPTAATPAAKA